MSRHRDRAGGKSTRASTCALPTHAAQNLPTTLPHQHTLGHKIMLTFEGLTTISLWQGSLGMDARAGLGNLHRTISGVFA